jgi:hypothetical protein
VEKRLAIPNRTEPTECNQNRASAIYQRQLLSETWIVNGLSLDFENLKNEIPFYENNLIRILDFRLLDFFGRFIHMFANS